MANSLMTISDDAVEIGVPLRAEHASTLRVIVASLGSDLDMSVDEIDDVKLAVSEVFALMCDGAEEAGATRARVQFAAAGDTIAIHLDRGLNDEAFELDALAASIISSVVDRHSIDNTGITLWKRAGETSA